MNKAIYCLEEEISAEQPVGHFVSSLQSHAALSRTANHPLLLAISQGKFHDLQAAIRCFLSEYYFYSHKFMRYLGAVLSSLEEPAHRVALIGNSAEEAGHVAPACRQHLLAAGINPDDVAQPHPELFRRFLVAIGVDVRELLHRPPLLATAAWIETFHDVCRHGGQGQAVGALGIATEGIVGHMFRLILQGITRAWPDLSAHDRAFFDLHALIDDDHAEVLRSIARSLSETAEGRRQIALGMVKALDARSTFFDYMQIYLTDNDQNCRRAS